MLEQLELYINAQKAIANYMLGLGIIMILLGVSLHFAGTNPLFHGLKIGCLVLGLFSAVSGYSYRITGEKMLERQSDVYRENPAEFKAIEKNRMGKVVKNFPIIQVVFVVLIIVSLVMVLIIKSSFINGLILSVVILLVGNIFIEKVSKASIDTYYEHIATLD